MKVIHGFEIVREREIPELKTEAALFRHRKTGAELLSLINDDENKVLTITENGYGKKSLISLSNHESVPCWETIAANLSITSRARNKLSHLLQLNAGIGTPQYL